MYIVNRSTASPVLGIKRVKGFKFSYANEIGRGGWAKVYTQSGRNGRKIAVKIDNERTAERYNNMFIEREAKTLLRFNHPNIVLCLGYGSLLSKYYHVYSFRVDTMSFAAFEYLENYEDAKAYVEKSSGNRLQAAMWIFRQVISAIEYIHSKGWVHADINEDNILTNGKNVKLIDFAVARPEGESIYPESEKWVAGTDVYKSLARLTKNLPTKADDIYALGIMLCDLLLENIVVQRYECLVGLERTDAVNDGFNKAQQLIDQRIESSNLPGPIKELMRRLIGLGEGQPFKDCREIREFIALMP